LLKSGHLLLGCGPKPYPFVACRFYLYLIHIATLLKTWTGPQGIRRLRLPEFPDIRHMKVVRLSAVCTGHFYDPGTTPGSFFS